MHTNEGEKDLVVVEEGTAHEINGDADLVVFAISNSAHVIPWLQINWIAALSQHLLPNVCRSAMAHRHPMFNVGRHSFLRNSPRTSDGTAIGSY